MQYRHITPAEAATMALTVGNRSRSFVEFGLAAAEVMGDTLAADLYRTELDRRDAIELADFENDVYLGDEERFPTYYV